MKPAKGRSFSLRFVFLRLKNNQVDERHIERMTNEIMEQVMCDRSIPHPTLDTPPRKGNQTFILFHQRGKQLQQCSDPRKVANRIAGAVSTLGMPTIRFVNIPHGIKNDSPQTVVIPSRFHHLKSTPKAKRCIN